MGHPLAGVCGGRLPGSKVPVVYTWKRIKPRRQCAGAPLGAVMAEPNVSSAKSRTGKIVDAHFAVNVSFARRNEYADNSEEFCASMLARAPRTESQSAAGI